MFYRADRALFKVIPLLSFLLILALFMAEIFLYCPRSFGQLTGLLIRLIILGVHQVICEQWGCTGQDLLDIPSREHQQAEMLQTSGLSDSDIAELAGGSRSSEDSDEIAFYDKQDGNED